MATELEIEHILEAITAALNDRRVERFESSRVTQLVIETIGAERRLTVDDGGGLHEENGVRIGAIRRTPSGEWITERQNVHAENSAATIPPKQQDD